MAPKLLTFALILGLGVTVHAQSIIFAPTLRTVSRTTAPIVMAGEHVGISFNQTVGTAPVQRTSCWFTDPTGARVEYGKDFQTVGSVLIATKSDTPLGRHQLDEIIIATDNGLQITFRRDGSVEVRPPFVQPGTQPPQIQAPRSHTLDFAALDFQVRAPDGGTVVSGSLAANTRWTTAGSPYRLAAKVVVPAGVTLTVEPGAKVIGAGHTIEVTGTLDVAGAPESPAVLSNVRLLPLGGTTAQPFLIRLDHAAMYGGSVWAITASDVFGTLQIRDSVLVDVLADRSLLRFPATDIVIERNVFYHSASMTLGTGGGRTGGITFRHNLFFEPDIRASGGSQSVDAYLLIFDQSGGPITIKGNSFITVSSFPAMRTIPTLITTVDASGNYFDTYTLAAGRAVQNFGALRTVFVDPWLTEPDAAAPTLPSAPLLTRVPADQTAAPGGVVTLEAAATGQGEIWYQWSRDGSAIPGATASTFVIPHMTSADAGTYTVEAGNFTGSVRSAPAIVTMSGPPEPVTSWLANVSVRTAMQAGQSPLVMGFATNGAKSLLVRAAGPALASYGVTQPLGDPSIALYSGGSPLADNDNWGAELGLTFAQLGAFPFAPGSLDSAVLQPIEGPATAHATGNGSSSGVVLVEAYDTDPTSGAVRLVNVSARNHVGTGGDILITGFFIHGTGMKRLLVRGVGPTLLDYGVTGVLADPKLEVYNAAGTRLAANDNWDAALTSTFRATQAFLLTPGSKDAALIVTLPAGAGYSVQLSGADGGTGQALVEVYEVP